MRLTVSGIQHVLVSDKGLPLEGAVAEEESKSRVHIVATSRPNQPSNGHTLGSPTNRNEHFSGYWSYLCVFQQRVLLYFGK